MEKRGIKAIVFDIGGVLQLGKYSKKTIRGHRELGVHRYVTEKLRISLDQYFDSIDTPYAKSIEGTIKEKDALNQIAKNLKISIKKLRKLFHNAYKKNFTYNRELANYAIKLRKKGYVIAILSDQWHLSKPEFLTKTMVKHFDPILISCDVGVRKPNPKFYKILLKKLKLPSKQVVFIDNQEWNIKPAKKLKEKTILFKNNKQTIRELEKLLK